MITTIFRTVVLAAVLASAGAAQAAIITFDEFKSDDTALPWGANFSTTGYQFSLLDGHAWFIDYTNYGNTAGNGTVSLDLGGVVKMTHTGNKLFSVTSIDLATVLALETSIVKLTGTDELGNRITQSFSLNGAGTANPYGLQTKGLTGFNRLTSLEMAIMSLPGTSSTYFSLVDNIVTHEESSAIPEPSIWALGALGAALLAAFSRRTARTNH